MTALIRRLSTLSALALLVVLPAACGAPKVKSLAVTPAAATVAAGTNQEFSAVATFTDSSKLDVTSAVTWVSSDPNIGAFDTETGKGVLRAHNAGAANITATFQGVVGKATLTVTA